MNISEEQYIKEKLACRDAVLRLRENPDFQKIVLEGYITEVPKGIITALAYTPKAGTKSVLLEKLTSISHFKQFLEGIVDEANRLEEELNNREESFDD